VKGRAMADSKSDQDTVLPRPGETIRVGKWQFRLPKNRFLRVLLGLAFVLGGIVGFLPVVGFWMFPVGLLILSHDIRPIRRWRRRLMVWAGRNWKGKTGRT